MKKAGVLGCGLMGSGIAEVCARAGYETVVREVDETFLKKGLARIENSLSRAVEKGKLKPEEKSAMKLSGTTKLEDLKDCDIIIEAIIENLDLKKTTYASLDKICKAETIFCSNTSSLTITEMSMATSRPDKFAGLHFFNPVPVMKLVEVVQTILTSAHTQGAVMEFARSLGKEPVAARDNSGFIVNRLLVPYLLDSIRALEEGVGSVEDIDKGMRLGCNYPMGPFELLDYVGIETAYYISEIMFNEYREKRFAPPPLMKKMVLAGLHGRKSGKGFYEYDEKGNRKA
jgi:3-hydroxybutyryl-CoA dehydrogenase